MKVFGSLFTLVLMVSIGCVRDPDAVEPGPPAPNAATAVYVLNEGQYSDPFGARLTVYDVAADSAYQDVIERANGNIHLGNTGDDMLFWNGKGYILMSGSEDLAVINLANNELVSSRTYPGATPHDMVIDAPRSRIYVTRLYKHSLFALDLTTLAVLDSISVGANPQGMVIAGDRLFVCNSGYGNDNTVTVIDLITLRVVETLRLSDGPVCAAEAPDGTIWFVCTGNAFGTPASMGRIYTVNPFTLAKVDSIVFAENLWGGLQFDNSACAYTLGTTNGRFDGGPVHRIQVSSKAVTLNYIPGTYYSLGYDTAQDELYAGDAKQFAAAGDVSIFRLGTLRKKFAAGIGPAVLQFKR